VTKIASARLNRRLRWGQNRACVTEDIFNAQRLSPRPPPLLSAERSVMSIKN
jgi:hypothetical protein